MMTLEEFKAARSVLSGVIQDTSLVYSPAFSRSTGNQVYIKPENMQVTGAYKIRGAYYKISTLTDKQRTAGLVTASAGNHAQGVAFAARAAGVEATVIMPTTTPLVKVNNTKDYGAKVVLFGETFDDAAGQALRLSEEQDLTYIHPFNDLSVATGQGTIAYEIFQSLPDVDVILVPIGGGGLAAGVSTLAKLLNPNVQVIGVEPAGAASMKASLEAGHVVTLPHVETIADGVAVKTPGDQVFPYVRANLDGVITIEDDELVDAFLDVMEKHKMVVENAGLLPIAALHHLDCQGKNVVSVLSGGNMDVITMSSLVQHGLINRGRIFTFSVHLPDRPGELLRVSSIVARENGNIIKLDHNQFVSINRQRAVGLRVTLEAFGHSHKQAILDALREEGYDAKELPPSHTFAGYLKMRRTPGLPSPVRVRGVTGIFCSGGAVTAPRGPLGGMAFPPARSHSACAILCALGTPGAPPILVCRRNFTMVKIAPSLLSADFTHLSRDVRRVSSADWLHVDVMDGCFVPNITIGVPVVQSLRKETDMVLDVHLMVTKPARFVPAFANAGADLLSVHLEADLPPGIRESLRLMEEHKVKKGVALRPITGAEAVLPYLEALDLILVMTVEPGFGGQAFMADQLPKIAALRRYIDRYHPGCALEVDGGITPETARQVIDAGADVLVAGSSVYGAADIAGAIAALRAAEG